MLDHLPSPDGLAQGPLGRLFKRRSGDVPARAVSSQPEQVCSRELGDLQDAFHVGGLFHGVRRDNQVHRVLLVQNVCNARQ